jgi:hypothetical protein
MDDVGWLRSLGEDGLAALLERRPEAMAAPAPVALSELAERLAHPAAVVAALRRLDRPTLQVAEAVAALGGEQVATAEAERLLGVSGSPDVSRALSTLAEHGLLTGDVRVTLVEAARYAFGGPLDLGPPLAALLVGRTAEDLKAIARNLRIPVPTRKAEVLQAVSVALRDADRVRATVGAAPRAVRELLAEVARSGEPVERILYFSPRHISPSAPSSWALSHGLLLPAGEWDSWLAMPAEVALALRGEGWTAPFDPVPPDIERVPVEPSLVERDAAAAGAALLRSVTGMLDAVGRRPPALLRTGGVGVRELRRLGKELRLPMPEVSLALALAHHTGLLGLAGDVAAPSSRYDEWLRRPPAQRLADLLAAWWSLPYSPLLSDGAWLPVADDTTSGLRAAVLTEAAREPGTAPADPAVLVALTLWRRPYGLGGPDPAVGAAAVWREAALVGAVGAGAVSEAGSALLRGADLPAALAGIGAAVRTVALQADLTAVVTGTPDGALAELLDAVADRESSGVATTWRFSPDSVRRALDAGRPADELTAGLAQVSPAGLPQPLAYLIKDVARRHGAVRGQDVACCLRSENTALLAEIAADRRLRGLGLRVLAPTVLVGAKPLADTLAALRAAGYAPVAEDADGAVKVERTAPARVDSIARPARTPSERRPPATVAPVPRDLARALLAHSDTALPTVTATLWSVRRAAGQLTVAEARILAHALDTGGAVTIDYESQTGVLSRRVIENAELAGATLTAWCRLRQDERHFTPSRLRGVTAGAEG